METDQASEVQQDLNYYSQLTENEVSISKTLKESANDQHVIQEHVQHHMVASNEEDVQVIEEITTVSENIQEDLQLSESTEYRAEFINKLLRSEAKRLANTKAKEEVTMWTLQYHTEELQENQQKLEKEILSMQAFKEEVHQKVKTEQSNYSQMIMQMNSARQHVKMLKQKYDMLEKTYQATLQDAKSLEQTNEILFQNYQTNKLELLKAIKKENESLDDIRSILKNESVEYNTEMNKMNNILKELTEAEVKVADECAEMRRKCHVMENELAENNKKMAKLLSNNRSLNSSIQEINVKELEAQKIEKEEHYQSTLNATEEDLINTKKSLNSAEELNNDIIKALENEVRIMNEYEAADTTLEEELIKLLSAQKELKEANEATDTKASSLHSELTSKLHETNCSLTKLNEEIKETVENKQKTIENLHVIQHKNHALQENLTDLQFQEEKLVKEINCGSEKLAELQESEATLKTGITHTTSLLVDAKENYFSIENTCSNQLKQVESELTCAKLTLENAKQDCSTKIKTLKGDLHVHRAKTEKADQDNRTRHQEMLQRLEQQLVKLKGDLKQEKEDLEQVKTAVNQKKITRDKLQVDLELTKIASQESSKKRDVLTQNVIPHSILKPPGRSVASKTVSWRVPSNSSIDSEASGEHTSWKSPDELFNALLRTSPPQRLEQSQPRKRSRND